MTACVFTVSVCRECGLPVHGDDCRFFGTLRASLAPNEAVEVIRVDDYGRAVEALREYGGHLDTCSTPAGAPDCDCGFDEAMLRALGRSERGR